ENLTEAVRAEVPYGPGLPPESAAGPVATAPALEIGPDAVPFSGLAAGSIIAGIPRVESQGASEVAVALFAPDPFTAFKAPHQSSPQTAIATVLSASESVAPKAVAGGQEFVALATGLRLGAQLLVPSTYTGTHAALRHLGPGSTVTLLNLGQESPAAGSPSALTLTGIVIDRTALTSLGIPVPESDRQPAEATSLASGKGGARNVAGDQTGQVQYLSTQAGIFSIHPPVELAIGSTLHLAIEEPGTGDQRSASSKTGPGDRPAGSGREASIAIKASAADAAKSKAPPAKQSAPSSERPAEVLAESKPAQFTAKGAPTKGRGRQVSPPARPSAPDSAATLARKPATAGKLATAGKPATGASGGTAAPAAAAAPTDGAPLQGTGQAQAPGTPPPLPEVVSYLNNWPVLEQILAALSVANPAVAANFQATLPNPAVSLTSGVLLFLNLLAGSDARTFLGETAARTLEAEGLDHLLRQLEQDFARLRPNPGQPAGLDWRPHLVPILTDQGIHALVLLTRPITSFDEDGQGKSDDDEAEDEGVRFVLEVRFSQFGPIQIDGWIRGRTLFVTLFTSKPLPERYRIELLEKFGAALEAGDFEGRLRFGDLAEAEIDVSSEIHSAMQAAPTA
ncbi:MAG: hypothetical protein V3R73_05395, partial [Sphingomonadales bacterium]